jgi:hypothetical protein
METMRHWTAKITAMSAVVVAIRQLNVKHVKVPDMSRRRTKRKLPMRIPLIAQMKWWQDQSTIQDKGGSFNLDLYLQICEFKLKYNEI